MRNTIEGTNGADFDLAPLQLGDTGLGALLSGASIPALSFLGFDAVTTLAEEAKPAERDIPRAIFIIVFSAGAFFVSITMAMQLLFPDVTKLDDVVSASPESPPSACSSSARWSTSRRDSRKLPAKRVPCLT
ncbi:MAG: amino acid permease [Nocardioides sp.]|uniref:amino acid permease n=1 Tax=Nocardioides sp. TaxID=35761 RepID=UPI0039E65096